MVSQGSYLDAWNRLVHELQLAETLAQFSYEFVKLPAAPWMEFLNVTNKASLSAWSKVPFANLPLPDLADIDNDPAKRQRYTELVRASYLPPLRHMADIVHTQVLHPPASSWVPTRYAFVFTLTRVSDCTVSPVREPGGRRWDGDNECPAARRGLRL
jgi:hypothetical protein